MNPKILDILCCPMCGNDLALESFEDVEGEVESGVLVCRRCGIYPIRKSIPRFHATCWEESASFVERFREQLSSHTLATSVSSAEEFLKRSKETKESFGFEWTRYHFDPQDQGWFKGHFLACTGIPEAWFAGKFVLDVGCGMGRYPRLVSDLGAEVVALELSHAVQRVKDTSNRSPRVHPIQGDLMRPPFKHDAFDLVYSIGVLHHTPNTRRAWSSIVDLPKTGGILAVQVYPRLRLEWLNALLRSIATRIPRGALYYLCLALVPIPGIPIVRTLLKPIPYSRARGWKERWNDNFDWYSPRYQHHHTAQEVVGWFEASAYDDVKVLPKYPLSVSGVRNGQRARSANGSGKSEQSSLGSSPELRRS